MTSRIRQTNAYAARFYRRPSQLDSSLTQSPLSPARSAACHINPVKPSPLPLPSVAFAENGSQPPGARFSDSRNSPAFKLHVPVIEEALLPTSTKGYIQSSKRSHLRQLPALREVRMNLSIRRTPFPHPARLSHDKMLESHDFEGNGKRKADWDINSPDSFDPKKARN